MKNRTLLFGVLITCLIAAMVGCDGGCNRKGKALISDDDDNQPAISSISMKKKSGSVDPTNKNVGFNVYLCYDGNVSSYIPSSISFSDIASQVEEPNPVTNSGALTNIRLNPSNNNQLLAELSLTYTDSDAGSINEGTNQRGQTYSYSANITTILNMDTTTSSITIALPTTVSCAQ